MITATVCYRFSISVFFTFSPSLSTYSSEARPTAMYLNWETGSVYTGYSKALGPTGSAWQSGGAGQGVESKRTRNKIQNRANRCLTFWRFAAPANSTQHTTGSIISRAGHLEGAEAGWRALYGHGCDNMRYADFCFACATAEPRPGWRCCNKRSRQRQPAASKGNCQEATATTTTATIEATIAALRQLVVSYSNMLN